MRMIRCPLIAASLLAGLAATPAFAHPHVFVETEVNIVFDETGAVAGVQLTWVYDDFFSFLLTTDLGIDPDGDMILTEDEAQVLSDYVLNWPADFGGDLFIYQRGQALALAPPQQGAVSFRDGRVRESHIRPLVQPVVADVPVEVQVYDPFYYVAYDVIGQIGMGGRDGCAAVMKKADLNLAYALVDELLYGRPASDVGPDEEFPEVGYAFADTVTVTCAG
jgi:ABC-type uncharacterized transport system substrate-binding protein